MQKLKPNTLLQFRTKQSLCSREMVLSSSYTRVATPTAEHVKERVPAVIS